MTVSEDAVIRHRVQSIDVLRGIVMIIMALDHVRDYFHVSANIDDPLNLASTTPALFFTRWITHFCAPVFVFLSGVSIYLQSIRKTKKELSSFLIKRGFWLVFVEVAIISLGITFNPFYNFIMLQVIWAIGISMIILGILVNTSFKFILALGLLIVAGHNLLDIPESVAGFNGGFFWDLFHSARFAMYPLGANHAVAIVYPFIPWLGLMLLGYCTGIFFTAQYAPAERARILMRTGLSLLLFFIVVRYLNKYGDPFPWNAQKNTFYTLLSFIRAHKYPPSLLYMCMTIGPALVFLSIIEKYNNVFTKVTSTYGRTAFFYYVLHFYLAHFICMVCFFARGHSLQEAIASMKNLPFLFVIPGEGYPLGTVYLVWALVVISLYPLCRWYDLYKQNHKEKKWLSYL